MSYRDKCSISHRCHNLNRLPCSEYQFPIRPVFTPNDIWAFLALFWCPYHRDNLFTHLIATKRFGCMREAAVHLCLGCLNWCSSAAVHVWQYQLQICILWSKIFQSFQSGDCCVYHIFFPSYVRAWSMTLLKRFPALQIRVKTNTCERVCALEPRLFRGENRRTVPYHGKKCPHSPTRKLEEALLVFKLCWGESCNWTTSSVCLFVVIFFNYETTTSII